MCNLCWVFTWFIKKVTVFWFGLALSAGIICASLALGEAGIEMYDLVSSCSLVRVKYVKQHVIVLIIL